MNYELNYLHQLEAEAIYIIREAYSQFKNCALLFSGGKDSIVMCHLARKAFAPAPLPFTLLHVDTGHNFAETLQFRDGYVDDHGLKLVVRLVEDSIKAGKASDITGHRASRNSQQSVTLLDAIEELGLDCCFGGGRRDEEKARAKERIFSHRDEFGQWEPKNQRPELWSLYNGKKLEGENFRVFPLSNWTELDIWQYIKNEKIALPSLYFSHERSVFLREGVYYAQNEFVKLYDHEKVENKTVRFRTIGDMTCTGATVSAANSIDDIIMEVAAATITERGGRGDDKKTDTAMEDRKKQGYF